MHQLLLARAARAEGQCAAAALLLLLGRQRQQWVLPCLAQQQWQLQ